MTLNRSSKAPYIAGAAIVLIGVFFGQTGMRSGQGSGKFFLPQQRANVAPIPPPAVQPLGTRQTQPGPAVANFLGYFGPGIDDGGNQMLYPGTRVAANGVSMRNIRQGAIQLSGCEFGEPVVAAFLYWAWLTDNPVPGLHDTMFMKRFFPNNAKSKWTNGIKGTLVGTGPDPCWGAVSNWVYRADVTNLVDKNGVKKVVKGGGTYQVRIPVNAAGRTNYRDPFGGGPDDAVPPLMEGVSLVIVYAPTSEVAGTTEIFDGTSLEASGGAPALSGHMYVSSPGISYGLVTATGTVANTEGRWINISADGQSGGGYANSAGTGHENATDWFSATQTMGGGGQGLIPYSERNRSPSNGSGGVPLPELFDVTGYDISPFYTVSIGNAVEISTPGIGGNSDCVVTVADILWKD